MAKKSNVFSNNITTFLRISVDLLHLLHFVPWQFRLASGPTEKSLAILEKKGIRNNFGPMTGSSIVDIFHNGEYVIRAPVGSRVTRGDDIKRMVAEVEGRFNASVLTSLHEALEAFHESAYGKMLFQLRDQITIRDRKAFHKQFPKIVKVERTPQYFNEYSRWSCRSNCAKACTSFRDNLNWSKAQIDGWGGMDWIALSATLGFCRHCIVHSEGRVDPEELRDLPVSQARFVQSLMRPSMLTGDERILPPPKAIDQFIEVIMSFTYGLYVLLSERCDMEVDVNPWEKQKKKTQKS
jgi:hypothetical protein